MIGLIFGLYNCVNFIFDMIELKWLFYEFLKEIVCLFGSFQVIMLVFSVVKELIENLLDVGVIFLEFRLVKFFLYVLELLCMNLYMVRNQF